MLRHFHIENFKSLTDFTLHDLGQFTCLIGLNGAGKTTVLQAIDFMAHLASGTVDNWLKERDWTRNDLTSKLIKKHLITFRLEFEWDKTQVTWEGVYNASLGRCTREEMRAGDNVEFSLIDGQVSFQGSDHKTTVLDLSRVAIPDSALAFIRSPGNQGTLYSIKNFMENIKSLELLAPHRMKMRSRAADDVGSGGEKLSGFLHSLSKDKKAAVLKDILHFYSHIGDYETTAMRAGWVEISAMEKFAAGQGNSSPILKTRAAHLNDGLLRILTIVAQTKTEHQFLLFDEIENGINPEKIGQLVKYLLDAKQQIVVTTHNPLILNFLSDERARESVFFLYRNRFGATKAVRFYEIPEVAEKLEVLGPGEAFLDTSLEELVKRIEDRGAVQA